MAQLDLAERFIFFFIWTSFQIATDRWDLLMDASMTVK